MYYMEWVISKYYQEQNMHDSLSLSHAHTLSSKCPQKKLKRYTEQMNEWSALCLSHLNTNQVGHVNDYRKQWTKHPLSKWPSATPDEWALPNFWSRACSQWAPPEQCFRCKECATSWRDLQHTTSSIKHSSTIVFMLREAVVFLLWPGLKIKKSQVIEENVL